MSADGNTSERPTGVRWLVFALACGTSFVLYLHRYTWNIVREELRVEHGFTNTQLETLGSLFYVTYSIGQIPSGIICDLFGAHAFLGTIIVGWALVLPVLGFTANYYVLGGVRLFFGGAQAGCYPALGQVTQRWFPRSSRTQIQGWVASFFGRSGGALSSIVMATVLMSYAGLSWPMALVVMAAVGIAFGGVFASLYRNAPEDDPRVNDAEVDLISEGEVRAAPSRTCADCGEPVAEDVAECPACGSTGFSEAAAAKPKRGLMPFGQALKNRTLQIMVGQQFANAGADIVYTNVMGSYFASQGVTKEALGFLISLPLIGGALGGLFGGYLNDWLIVRLGSRRWARSLIGFFGKVLATVSLVVALLQTDPVWISIWLFTVKFFTDWTQPTVWGTCTDIGGRYSATVFSINNTAGNVGAMVVPVVLIGPLLDFYSTKEVVDGAEKIVSTNYTPMFVLVGALYVFAGVLWLFVDCTREVKPPDEA